MGGFGLSGFHLSTKSLPSQSLNDKYWPGEVAADRREVERDLPEGIVVIGIGVILVICTFAIYAILMAIPRAFSLLEGMLGNTGGAIFCGCAALLIGWLLFELRHRQRGVYAFLELTFAFSSAALAMSRLHVQGNSAVWLAFAAAAYLVVRGLDNLTVAKGEEAWPWPRTMAPVPTVLDP